MTTTGARAVGSTGRQGSEEKADKDGKSLAQWVCLIGGPLLILAGLIGLLNDSTFDTYNTDASPLGFVNGDQFLGFEVNGWSNVFHIAVGLLLVLGAVKHGLAKTACLIGGLAFAAACVLALIDGKDVLGLFPANGADKILWGVLAALLIIAALVSTRNRRDRDDEDDGAARVTPDRERAGRDAEPPTTRPTAEREVVAPASGNGRVHSASGGSVPRDN